jgi:primosomal protein N' (replication factor Y)
VVELAPERAGALKDIAAVSGGSRIFDRHLLRSLEWAANHYVAPMSVVLERAAPPNLPRAADTFDALAPPPDIPHDSHPLGRVAADAAAGRRRPVSVIVTSGGHQWHPALTPVLAANRSAIVVLATAAEATAQAEAASATFGDRVVAVGGDVAQELTHAWELAQSPGRLVIGTPRLASWKVAGLSLAIVIEEGRRAMKDRQTPTIHVREMLLTRARVEGFSLAFMGPTPSLETLAAGAEISRVGARPWPHVEVVDRSEEPPGSGLLSEPAIAGLRAVSADGRRSIVFTHRRLGEASARCTNCRRVRVCGVCGSRLGRVESCRRCGAPAGPCDSCGSSSFEEMGSIPERVATEINRRSGGRIAAPAPTSLPVIVGTERDLAGLSGLSLAVATDVDGLMLGHDYRAAEEAMRVLARLGNTLGGGAGRRMMLQTSLPDSDLVAALRRGDPIGYLEGLLSERARLGLPPASEMIAVEMRGDTAVDEADAGIRGLGAAVLGPAVGPGKARWLLQGSLGQARVGLRRLAHTWREQGLTVRIDADPIDL